MSCLMLFLLVLEEVGGELFDVVFVVLILHWISEDPIWPWKCR